MAYLMINNISALPDVFQFSPGWSTKDNTQQEIKCITCLIPLCCGYSKSCISVVGVTSQCMPKKYNEKEDEVKKSIQGVIRWY